MRELLLDTLPGSAGTVLLWALLGGLGGLALGTLLFLLFRRFGAWRLDAQRAKFLRVLALLWLLGVGLAAGAAFGAAEGALRGACNALDGAGKRPSPIQPAADALSVALFWIDRRLDGIAEPAVEEYRSGRAALDAPGFLARLERAEEGVVDGLAASWKAQAQARLGTSKLVDGLLDLTLKAVGRRLVRKTLDEAERQGFLAALEGGPRHHGEVAGRLLHRWMIPLATSPLRSFLRMQQAVALLAGLALAGVPVLGFWIGRRKWSTKAAGSAILPGDGGSA